MGATTSTSFSTTPVTWYPLAGFQRPGWADGIHLGKAFLHNQGHLAFGVFQNRDIDLACQPDGVHRVQVAALLQVVGDLEQDGHHEHGDESGHQGEEDG